MIIIAEYVCARLIDTKSIENQLNRLFIAQAVSPRAV
ncbi:hypothetical protein DIKCMJMK_01415 [Shewanella oneidensis]|nr:hypothetical protein [Shewanella oneidensis]